MLKFKTTPKPETEAKVAEIAENAKLVLLSAHAELIDEVGALTEEAAPILAEIGKLQALLVPLSEKKAELQKIMDALGGDEDALKETGGLFYVEAGKRGKSREITDMALVKKLMGTETFMKVATVKLGDIDKYLTLPEREQVTKTNRTSRTLKIARRAA